MSLCLYTASQWNLWNRCLEFMANEMHICVLIFFFRLCFLTAMCIIRSTIIEIQTEVDIVHWYMFTRLCLCLYVILHLLISFLKLSRKKYCYAWNSFDGMKIFFLSFSIPLQFGFFFYKPDLTIYTYYLSRTHCYRNSQFFHPFSAYRFCILLFLYSWDFVRINHFG